MIVEIDRMDWAVFDEKGVLAELFDEDCEREAKRVAKMLDGTAVLMEVHRPREDFE